MCRPSRADPWDGPAGLVRAKRAFDDADDEAARTVFCSPFDDRRIATIEANPILHGGRALHGISLAEPIPFPR